MDKLNKKEKPKKTKGDSFIHYLNSNHLMCILM